MTPAMALPEKFLFDTIFDEEIQVREEKKKEPEGPPLVHTEQALIDAVEQVRQETQETAFAEGRDAGIGAVRDAADSHATEALEAMAAALPALMELRQSIVREAHKNATALALQIGAKLADAVLRQHPADQVTKMIADALAEIGGGVDQRILIRVNPDLLGALEPRMEAMRQRTAATGELTLIPDETLQGSACRVEWPEGGADRDPAKVAAEIEAALHRYLALVEDLPEYQGENFVLGQAPGVGEPGLASALDALATPPSEEPAGLAPAPDQEPESEPGPEPDPELGGPGADDATPDDTPPPSAGEEDPDPTDPTTDPSTGDVENDD